MTPESNPTPIPGPPLDLPRRIWLVLFVSCGVASNLLCDALWDEAVMAAFLAVGIIVIETSRRVHHVDSTNPWVTVAVVVCHGLLLGVLLVGTSMLAWFLVEVLTRGSSGIATLWFLRLVLAAFLGAIVFLLLKRQTQRGWEYARRTLAWTLFLGTLFGFTAFFYFSGPTDLSVYPLAQDSEYRLPWKPGIRRLCIQGNRTVISHWKSVEFAYDFVMPVGTKICAARAGQVVEVVDHNEGNGSSAPGNHVFILHADGTHGLYAHIRKHGRLVEVGQLVERGDVIAESGNVGISMLPHVHFQVMRGGTTIPVTFADVPGDGIPRMFRRYRSGS